MSIQPVPGIPALKVDETLVIGDLHIGVEAHLGKKASISPPAPTA